MRASDFPPLARAYFCRGTATMNRRYQAHPDPDHPMHKRIEQAVQDSEREYPRMVEMTEGDAVLILAAFIVAKDDAHVKGYHPIEARIAELAERWFPE